MHSRRNFLTKSGLLAAGVGTVAEQSLSAQMPRSAADDQFVIQKGHIHQSIMGWCFKSHFSAVQLAHHCKALGMVAMEGIPRSAYPEVKKLGLEISLVSSHSFTQGPCNPKEKDLVIDKLTEAIDVAKQVGCKQVIAFTGMRFDGMDDEKAAQRCVDVWKKVVPHAEKNNVTITLEQLNSRDHDQAHMKGHPGYFGDDLDFCVDLINRVGSDHFKLLFDIYHVSIMNGDMIRRIRQYKDVIAHYHTAGNPGRGELDDTQEIGYPAIMREILKTGYQGYVAQEFIPTWDDPVAALRHAVQLCDV